MYGYKVSVNNMEKNDKSASMNFLFKGEKEADLKAKELSKNFKNVWLERVKCGFCPGCKKLTEYEILKDFDMCISCDKRQYEAWEEG